MSVSKGIEILALRLHSELAELKSLEEKVKEKVTIIHKLKTKDLAEMVDSEGYQVGSKIVLSNGKTITVKEFFTSEIPTLTKVMNEKDPLKQVTLQERRVKAFAWLDKNGKGDIIKNTVNVKFNREESNKAKQLMEWLLKKGIEATRDENVHASTLNATLKEAMANGESVPMDVFKIYRSIVVDAK